MIDHPLTHEIIKDLWTKTSASLNFDDSIDTQVIRAAYDKGAADRLEQVIEWIKATKSTVKLCPSVLADQIEEEMRPQQQEDN